VVTLGQLQSAGLTASAVRSRVQRGRLYRVHRGVYAVGHARLTAYGRVMAAVFACGERATASHRTAAWLLGLRAANRSAVEVSVRARSVRQRPGIQVHASPSVRVGDIARCHGIPCTTVARTALDLGEVVPKRQVVRVLQEAAVRRVFDLRVFEDLLRDANGHRGAGVLRQALAEIVDEPGLTASDIEELFLDICSRGRLPAPEVNRWLRVDGGEAIKADFLWRAERLIVEVDGWTFHGTRSGFERDRRRDQRTRRAGWEQLRFTWRQLASEPGWVLETVGALLARRVAVS
jgi:very-short-patch-repair endonuclease